MMKKVNWEPKHSNKYATAYVGSTKMQCCLHYCDNGKCKWFASVRIGSFLITEYGPIRHKLSDAKADCIRIACELLLDCQAGLDIEKANFSLVE